MTRSAHVPAVLGALLLVGALSGTTLASESPGASPPGPAASSVPSLEGTEWLLTKARLSGAFADIPEEVVATLRMVGGHAGGSGGCNQWFADYVLDGQSLSFGQIGSTLMFCAGSGGQVETFYFADLAGVTTWRIDGTTLTLSDDTGDPVLAFEPRTAIALSGDWLVTDYNDGQGSVVAVPDGSVQVTIGEGRIAGTAGCNQFMGPLSQDGGSVAIGPLMATEMACRPQAIMDREAAVMAALEASTSVQQADAGLTFLDAAGTLQVHLVPAVGTGASPAPSAAPSAAPSSPAA